MFDDDLGSPSLCTPRQEVDAMIIHRAAKCFSGPGRWKKATGTQWWGNLMTINIRFHHGEYYRVSGEVVCPTCRRQLYDHPVVYGFLNLTCDGELVKL